MTALATAIYRGTRPVATLDAGDRGFAYGDGVFTTALVHDRHVVWQEAHLRRLAGDAARLGITPPDPAWLTTEMSRLLDDAPARAVLKIVVTRGASSRGYSPSAAGDPTLLLSLHAEPPPLPAALVVRWCETRVAMQPALAGIKHLNRLEQVLARGEWSGAAVHEGLMLDTGDRLAGATAANVFVRVGDQWHTPPVDRRGVAGIARAWVLAHLPGSRECELTRAQVDAADAVFLCNAVRGILPVGTLGDRRLVPHPALADLRRRLGRDHPAFDPGS